MKVEKKPLPPPPPPPDEYTITLTKQEAIHLADLLACIGGHDAYPERNTTNELHRQLSVALKGPGYPTGESVFNPVYPTRKLIRSPHNES